MTTTKGATTMTDTTIQLGVRVPAGITLERDGATVEVYRAIDGTNDARLIGSADGWSAYVTGKPRASRYVETLEQAVAYIIRTAD
jgi:hypothetical protein